MRWGQKVEKQVSQLIKIEKLFGGKSTGEMFFRKWKSRALASDGMEGSDRQE